MTPAEVSRAIKSRNRIIKLEAREKAAYDYVQAQLIIKGVAICLGDKSAFPTKEEAYPGMFDDPNQKQKKVIQERKDELSALRFRQFAQSYNNKFKNKEVPK